MTGYIALHLDFILFCQFILPGDIPDQITNLIDCKFILAYLTHLDAVDQVVDAGSSFCRRHGIDNRKKGSGGSITTYNRFFIKLTPLNS